MSGLWHTPYQAAEFPASFPAPSIRACGNVFDYAINKAPRDRWRAECASWKFAMDLLTTDQKVRS